MMGSEKTVEIKDIERQMQGISIKGKIVNINQRKVTNDRGESILHYGIIGDTTGTIPFTAWTMNEALKSGDVVLIKNCSSREFKGTVRVYLDSGSTVKLLPNEDMEVKRTSVTSKIGDLSQNSSYVTIRGKTGKIYEREFEREGKKTTIFSTRLEDDTGSIRVSSFGQKLPENAEIEISGARVNEYNGSLGISVGENTQINPVKLGFKIKERYLDIGSLKGPVGGISIRGIVISVGPKSGLVYRCSDCNARLEEIRCPDHPDAKIKYDIFAYFTLDDGTGTVQATAGLNQTLSLIGIREEEFNPDNRRITKSSVKDGLIQGILGKAVKITGDLREQSMGFSLRCFSLSHLTESEINQLMAEQEVDFQ